MIRLLTKTAKSARRHLAATLLAVFALAAGGAYVVYAAGKADYTISATPSAQTVDQGKDTSYVVSANRVNGYSDPVTLSVTGLPAGATATWKLPNGSTTTSPILTSTVPTMTLVVQTAKTTPAATSALTLTGTSGKTTRTTTVSLTVQNAKSPTFALGISPASQTVVKTESTNFALSVDRSGGYTGGLALSASGLPAGTTATWQPGTTLTGGQTSATLILTTSSTTPTGSFPITVTASGTGNGVTIARTVTATMLVEEGRAFTMTGNVAQTLSPGRSGSIHLVLTNPNKFRLSVTGITVLVNDGTSKKGCSGLANFAVTQMPAASFPFTIQGNQTASLTQLAAANGKTITKPVVAMLNRSVNQDVCKGATVNLQFSGSAAK